tara:strand:- start:22284 stop:22421 length:138 start_codon:yes stop_codon:yes gene_type:complete
MVSHDPHFKNPINGNKTHSMAEINTFLHYCNYREKELIDQEEISK